MKQNRNITWDIFSNIFIVLLIAGFIYLVYVTLGTGPESFFTYPYRNLFSIALILLFSVFFVLLGHLVSLWFCKDWKDCVLIVPEEITTRARYNIIFAIAGFTVLLVLLPFITVLVKAGELSVMLYHEKIIYNVTLAFCLIIYGAVLITLFYRSFVFRNLVLKVSGDVANRVRERVSLFPYLFLTFLLFEHLYWFGLIFLGDMGWAFELVGAFQLLAVVWIFCAWKINDLFYMQKEYDSMLHYESLKATGLGTGIGVYPNSFFKIWVFGGAIYWGVPVFIYFLVFVIIVSMFLPLFKIVEKLG